MNSASPETLHLFDQAQFRTQNRFPLLLELLYVDAGRASHINAAAGLGAWPEGKRRGIPVDPVNVQEVGRNAPNSRLRSRRDVARLHRAERLTTGRHAKAGRGSAY